MMPELGRIREKYAHLSGHPEFERLIELISTCIELTKLDVPDPVKAVNTALVCQEIIAFCNRYGSIVGEEQMLSLKSDLYGVLAAARGEG